MSNENITKIEPNPTTEFYKIKDNSKVFCILDIDSLSFNTIDGSIRFENLPQLVSDEEIDLYKDTLHLIVETKNFKYTFFNFVNGMMVTEYSNVEEIKNHILIN